MCVGYVLLRLWRLSDSCLWFDEIFSVHAATQPWDNFLQFLALDLIHPPLFYAALKLWIAVGGEGLFWLRLFPVIFAVLALIPFLGICRELSLRNSTTIVALVLFAVNGSLIKYGQEVRMYSMLFALSLLSFWLFLRYFDDKGGAVLLVVANVLVIYTHYFGWLVIFSQIVAILLLKPARFRFVAIMAGVCTTLFVPWLILVAAAANSGSSLGQNIGWMEKPGLAALFRFAFDVIEPFYFQNSSAEASSIFIITVPIILIIAPAKLLYFLRSWADGARETHYLLAIFCGVPIVAALAASWLMPYSIWGSRNLIIAFAPMLILVSIFITEIQAERVRRGLIAALVLLTAMAFALRIATPTPEYVWCVWGDFATKLPTDVPTKVIVTEDLVGYHWWFATRGRSNISVEKATGIDGLTEDVAYFLPRGFDGVKNVAVSSSQETAIWLAVRAPKLSENDPPLKNLLAAGFTKRSVTSKKIGREEVGLIHLQK